MEKASSVLAFLFFRYPNIKQTVFWRLFICFEYHPL